MELQLRLPALDMALYVLRRLVASIHARQPWPGEGGRALQAVEWRRRRRRR